MHKNLNADFIPRFYPEHPFAYTRYALRQGQRVSRADLDPNRTSVTGLLSTNAGSRAFPAWPPETVFGKAANTDGFNPKIPKFFSRTRQLVGRSPLDH
jgi:hypothetical protein